MTREEAINTLGNFKRYISGGGVTDLKANEAIDMAIEALNREQEKYDAICSELVALKNNLNEPIEVAMAYENSIAIVRKYALKGFERF